MIETVELSEDFVRGGLISADDLRKASELRMRFVEPAEGALDEELMAKIPREIIERHQIVPLRGEHGVLLALSDPEDFRAIDEVQFLSSRPVETALAPRASIRRAIDAFYERAARARRADERPKAAATTADLVRRVLSVPGDALVRALVLALIEKGQVEADRLFAYAVEIEAARASTPGSRREPSAQHERG